MKNLTNLTPNQTEIIHNLIEEFKQMNAPKVSSNNPLIAILEELQSDKSYCDEQIKIAEARVKVLSLEIEDNLQKISDYFDELGFELEPIWETNGAKNRQSLSYRIRGEEVFYVSGFMENERQYVGKFSYACNHKIRYEVGFMSSYNYSSIESLIESSVFKSSVSTFLKHLIQTQQDA